jgi:hypothetical protein
VIFPILPNRIRNTALCILLAAAVIAYGVHRHHRFQHFAVHEQGRVYRSAWLEADAIAELVRIHHLRTVVNLCEPGELGTVRRQAEREAVASAGARLIELTMPIDSARGDELTDVERHLAALRDPQNFPMLVHCQQGVTRTAKFLLLYDVGLRGLSADDALAAMPLFGRDKHDDRVRAFGHRLESNRRISAYEKAEVCW